MKCLFGLSHQNRVSHQLKNSKSYVGDFVRCLDTASSASASQPQVTTVVVGLFVKITFLPACTGCLWVWLWRPHVLPFGNGKDKEK